MDEVFSIFLDNIGAPFSRREVPPSSIDRYNGKLPELLLAYWKEHGWCGFGEGIFWLVNPQDYEGVVSSWTEGTLLENRDTYHLIARSAFGDLYLWGENSGFSVKITSLLSRYTGENCTLTETEATREVQSFFLSRKKEHNDFESLFEPAKKKLGILKEDEIYAFVPALMLGGRPDLKNLEKLKAIEHLILLSQITKLEPYSFSDF
ncbi:GAD-like domain-containing protein [Pseudomonas putida]|uniref:GAD-like domain-containing protein n=1 Tax=Pseudomonas putida TaxID=303 RepID=UPI000CD42963|nr:GAD-like domain-containing protein [Pseudomonas putida]POF94630.1 glutamyl-tRNA amidotransferase [Pseudomonas putida]WRW05617.1 GAD-like domain-containing protein [Pseudomonas putida]